MRERCKPADSSAGKLLWPHAGMIMFAFAAPSAVMAVPYLIGTAGYLGGLLICLVVTGSAVGGSMMLLRIKLWHRSCHTFGDLGREVLGRPGQLWGNAIQLGNFCLFLPCALQFCALALEGIGGGIAGFGGCSDYYMFSIALVCLLTTQLRTLSKTMLFSYISSTCVLAMATCMVVAAWTYDNQEKVPAQMFGNPEGDATTRLLKATGGFTIAAWAYVPSFLTVELATCMEDPKSFGKSLLLSATLNVLMVVVVGFTVVSRWGYDVGEVISITSGVAAFQPGSRISSAFNVFQLVGNFVSYMLDSIPLGRFCQRAWAPNFADAWSAADVARYLAYTMPTFLFAVLVAVFVPSVNTLLDFTTAFTIPMVTQIYPAALYWRLFCRGGGAPALPMVSVAGPRADGDGALRRELPSGQEPSRAERAGVLAVLAVGCASLVLCLAKAVGYLAIEELRPPMRIGCGRWTVWSAA